MASLQITDDAVTFASVAVNDFDVLPGQSHVRANILRALVGNLHDFFFVGLKLQISLVNGQPV